MENWRYLSVYVRIFILELISGSNTQLAVSPGGAWLELQLSLYWRSLSPIPAHWRKKRGGQLKMWMAAFKEDLVFSLRRWDWD